MTKNQIPSKALSWEELSEFIATEEDPINGATNSYALTRLFGQPKDALRVTLYRDNHAWCPYCQKVWLWLEWKQIPYTTKKVTMRCYGKKENWYLRKVPSGMLPALELDGQLITESDLILIALENVFGPLGKEFQHPQTLNFRNLERQLFRAWCSWLCRPSMFKQQELQRKKEFQTLAKIIEEQLSKTPGPWFDTSAQSSGHSCPSSSDIIFIPYLERMNASLAYYKGLNLREEHPIINRWFNALEQLSVYRGTQGDFHTHAHDLPPQMGGCWTDQSPTQKKLSFAIDSGKGLGEFETSFSDQEHKAKNSPEAIALKRVLKHRTKILEINPMGASLFDQPLRAALTKLISGNSCSPERGSALGLRYLKDRISVPRDMPVLSARKLRHALEETAQNDSSIQGPPIPKRDRFDQDPTPFIHSI